MSSFSELMGAHRFASGVLTYTDHFGGDDARNTRIVVPVRFGRRIFTNAIVDTGALWCILNPEDAELIDSSQMESIQADRLVVRGTRYVGTLFRMPITLYADEGDNLTIDSTVFVPLLSIGEKWLHPNFLGLDGFLHRLRFAVDPQENAFYFGEMEG